MGFDPGVDVGSTLGYWPRSATPVVGDADPARALLSRRRLLRLSAVTGLMGLAVVAGCAPAAAPAPTSAPTAAPNPTTASAPAPAATTAAAPAAATAAPKPAAPTAAAAQPTQAAPAAGGSPATVHFVSTRGALGDWTPYVGIAQHFFEQAGLNVQKDLVGASPELNSAIVSGHSDVGVGAIPIAISSVIQNAPLKLFMATQIAYPGGAYNNWWCVLPNSPIKSIEDLAGKKVHIGASIGSLAQVATHVILRNHGLPVGQYEEQSFTFDQAYAALKTNRADIALFIEPFYTAGNALAKAEYSAPLRIVYTYLDAYPNGLNLTGFMGNTDFMAKNPDTMKKFVKALVTSAAWGKANPDQAKQIIADAAGAPYDTIKDMILSDQSPDGKFFPGFLQTVQQNLIAENAVKGLTTPLSDDKIVDLSFLQSA